MDNPSVEETSMSMSSQEHTHSSVPPSTSTISENGTSSMNIPLTSSEKAKSELVKSGMFYTIHDEPPLYLSFVLGFQHYLTVAGSSVSVPFILCPAMCMLDVDIGRAQLISTIMFVSGIVTLIQSTFGSRLPIIQGGSFSFLIPAIAILSLPEWRCPPNDVLLSMSQDERTELWQLRMRELSGAIIVASLFEVILGFFGIVGVILKYITPLTVAPAIVMIGLPLFKVSARHAESNWGIAILTIAMIVIFTQYLKKWELPIPFTQKRFPVFEIFPFLITIAIVWGICAVLTATDVLPMGNQGRSDVKLTIIKQTDWIILPYPFQWGYPTCSVGAVLGMLSGVIAGIVESIGDYYACARISGAKPPPKHALNRGIFTEGVGCVLAGIFGTGNGTTSYSENIGAISVTKVGSRRVIQAAGLLMIIFSLFGKMGAVFVSIPEPIIGGIFCIVFATVTAVGLSNLQGVDLNSSRNIFIIGFSIFFAMVISQWVDANSNAIDVGVTSLNQIIKILLSTGMFVAGFLGFLFDNTIPGTPEERGLLTWSAHLKPADTEASSMSENYDESYDLPYVMDFIKKHNWFRFVPISPTFHGFNPKLPKLPTVIRKNKISISRSDNDKITNNFNQQDRLKVYNAS